MKRVVKDPKIRRNEILAVAGELFKNQGYVNTTVEAIIQQVGVAKGTFYYYFKSKEDILDALVHAMVDQFREDYKRIADNPKLSAMDKMRQMLRGQNQSLEKESELMENLHRPENRELHERINIEIIIKISPVFAQVIEQGKIESVFNVENSLETIQFLLAGSQFLLESGLFMWNQEEEMKRKLSMQSIIERSLGANPGSFSFIR
ncbi:TetR/AcrR family transcriptional regulator [Desulfosporosinus fructosivorans]|uniref:TetR/AcrR family transcriptional regulator n=1 Tax=Desulfosporosinus fructosivorans TaxID=2018669 RepID=A0A4Z0QWE2_9FIRM|nr:TetR/AcrR family transcriptional regulator [Desulfosporosinus fructosivorans]TGE34834.1 TetR/AcrR family transcriptional regulator [Desulfosporosinus fructosivorans]